MIWVAHQTSVLPGDFEVRRPFHHSRGLVNLLWMKIVFTGGIHVFGQASVLLRPLAASTHSEACISAASEKEPEPRLNNKDVKHRERSEMLTPFSRLKPTFLYSFPNLVWSPVMTRSHSWNSSLGDSPFLTSSCPKPVTPDTVLTSGSVWFGGTFGHELLYQYCGLAILVGQGQLASVGEVGRSRWIVRAESLAMARPLFVTLSRFCSWHRWYLWWVTSVCQPVSRQFSL